MSDTPPTKNYLGKIALLIGIIVLVVLGFYIINFAPFIPTSIKSWFVGFSDNRGDWGTFGDYVGGTLNPLFGFFGFITLLVTLSLQRKQLDEQRKDMEQQRKEAAAAYELQLQQIEAQRKEAAANQQALDEAHKLQQLQQFESTFFILLEKIQEELKLLKTTKYSYDKYTPGLKKGLRSNHPASKSLSRDRIDTITTNIENYIAIRLKEIDTAHCTETAVSTAFAKVHEDVKNYITLNYHALKLIDASEINNKDYYINLLQDFSGDGIKLLLALNIYRENNNINPIKKNSVYYKELVEKFSIFEGLKQYMRNHYLNETTEFYQQLTAFYAASAFEKPQPSAA